MLGIFLCVTVTSSGLPILSLPVSGVCPFQPMVSSCLQSN